MTPPPIVTIVNTRPHFPHFRLFLLFFILVGAAPARAQELEELRAYEDRLLNGAVPIERAMGRVVEAAAGHGGRWWAGGAAVPEGTDSSWDRSILAGLDAVGRGREIFHRTGCFVCHGQNAAGGVRNFNYIKDTFPQLSTIAERMFIKDLETQKAALAVLGKGIDLDGEIDDEEIDIPKIVATQYRSVVKIVQNGNPAQIKNPAGPPPVAMPTWRAVLSDGDIRDMMAYFISLAKYDEDEDE